MSLELRISELTDAVQKLIAVMQSQGVAAPAAAAAPAPAAAARRGKASTAAAAPAGETTGSSAPSTPATSETSTSGTASSAASEVNDGKKVSIKLRAGDPEGTRYFHIAAHNTVAAVKPGEIVPSIAGMGEIGGDEYDTLKAQYSGAMVPPGNAPAVTPTVAPATTAAATASPAAQTSSRPVIDGPAVMEVCKSLHARDGNDGLRKVLDHFKAGKVGELVANTAQHAEVHAFVSALLNPAAPAAAAPASLF